MVADPVRDVEDAPFHLAYHGLDDKPLLEKLSRLFVAVTPSLVHVPARIPRGGLPRWPVAVDGSPQRPIRVGFFSKFFHENHAHGQLLQAS